MESCSLFIVGAGPAGMAAAATAREAGCTDIVIADRADRPGGILPQCVHEGFGLSALGTELTGPAYAGLLESRLEGPGIRLLLNTEVLRVSADRTALLSSRGGLTELRFERMILAAGCRERSIGALSVTGTRPAGVYTAGQAQEMINLRRWDLGERIVILGSGDLGMIMARRFTLEGKQVLALLEQEAHIGGMARNYHRCIEAFGIPVRFRSTVAEVCGAGRVSGVTVRNLDSGEEEFLPCDALVTAVGLIPERELVRTLGGPDWLTLAGNCSRVHDLVDSAVAEAERAGREAGSALAG
jgi:NADPH-dependent 2,4-dienoyl-CoA reductase/sulfur reductase-like enzyme